MYVKTSATDEQIRKNGCDIRQLYPWDNVVTPPWNSTLCSIRPTESSTPHDHATDETFIFTTGEGLVQIGEERRSVVPGDVIYIPHGTRHIVTNTSETEALSFVSIYWLQPSAEAGADAEAAR